MTTVRDNLIAAKALIDTPAKWGRKEYADNQGCLCAIGAIGVAAYGRDWWLAENGPEGKALAKALPFGWIVSEFNDDKRTTHEQIMALFDRAIAASE